jgi:hypothetical protein
MGNKPSKHVKGRSGSIATIMRLDDWRNSSGSRRMHGEQSVCGQVVPFPLERTKHHGPCRRRNASAPTPLDDNPMTFTDVGGHLGEGSPAGKNVLEVLHRSDSLGDGLSRQEGLGFPVRSKGTKSENLRMGRARSPIQFNKDLALRLKSARVAAGYERAQDFAKELGVEYERYKKWEGGRTPIQHEYLPRACVLLKKDANYFYGIRPAAAEQEQRRALP